MALSGTLDSFPLPEVLRLLGRSGQTGMLLVKAGDQEMRAYLQGGQLLFATSGDERVVKARLVGGGLLDRDGWDRVSVGEASADEVLLTDVSPLDYDRAVRSLTVDGIVEVMMRRQGTFEFEEGVTTSIRLGTELSIDDTLEEVQERLRAWNAIREIVPSMTVKIHLAETLPEGTDRVEIDAADWELLKQVAMGTSVSRMAARAGTSEFEMASKVVAFVSRGLAWVGEAVRAGRSVGSLDRFPGVEASDDPLGAEGPTGWTNELDAIPATAEPDPEPPPPLTDDDVGFSVGADGEDHRDETGDAVDFGLRGFAPRPTLRDPASDDAPSAEDVDDTGESSDSEGNDPVEVEAPEHTEGADVVDDVLALMDGDDDVAEEADTFGADDDAEETEAASGAIPSLLRRRSKGLLARELSSLGD